MEPKDTLSPYTDSPACTQSDTDIDIKRLLDLLPNRRFDIVKHK